MKKTLKTNNMKKTLITIALALTGFASFGQGYFLFTGNPRTAFDTFTTPGTSKGASTMDVGFLWGSTAATPLISGILASGTSTNSVASGNGSQFAATAWSDLLSDPNFTVAVNSGTSATVIVPTAATGNWSYNSAGSFGVTGTAAASYTVIVFAWNGAYATPTLAKNAGAAVGWSAPFTYAAVSSIGSAPTMALSGLTAFGVVNPVPEPATMALFGLGGLSLLMFRRRS
jgi:hypothetical protein